MLFQNRTQSLNRYSIWQYLILIITLVMASLYALPNLYDEDPAVQISPQRGNVLRSNMLNKIENLLQKNNIVAKSVTLSSADEQILIRLKNSEDQLKVQKLANEAFSRGYIIALNLAPTTPQWLNSLGALPMYLGLDLRGGVYFLMEVDIETAVTNSVKKRVDEVKTILRTNRVRYKKIEETENGVIIKGNNNSDLEKITELLSDEFFDSEILSNEQKQQISIVFTENALRDIRQFAVKQNIITLRNRVNELGVAEPIIQQQGANHIVVQLPGVQDTARAKEILGATATLEYRMVYESANAAQYAQRGYAPTGAKLYYTRSGEPILLKNKIIVTGENIINAQSGIDQQGGSPMVSVTLDNIGGNRMLASTKKNVGKRMAVVFIETRLEKKEVNGKIQKRRIKTEKVINIAVIREQFANRFQTTGLDSSEEARDLSLLLRAGSLAAPMDIGEERTVGPNLGEDNINQGFISVVIGFLLVLIFMAIRYKVFGLIANLALTANIVMVISLLSLMQATLTLPGIAGILLTVGMAVDANVLIFERIREELKNETPIQQAIHSGYNRAFITIADANITTLIAAIVLFSFGTGPIKGFAVTLSFGIITSMFTSIMGTRAVVNLIYGNKKIEKLSL